jgi:uroporphyrinogen-III synthase
VYETLTNALEAPGTFDGILFFSPSAVHTFCKNNTPGNAAGFCIGPTTAATLKEHHGNAVTASQPTAEHLILETIKYFKNKKTTI